MMTSFGTVAPAKVLVIGGTIVGLQAIATAKRLERGHLLMARSSKKSKLKA